MQSVNKMLQFFKLVGQLKRVKRQGWVLRDVPDPETVADHMYRMAIMAMVLDSSGGIDREKCVKLALVHDMAECIVGDLTPWDNVSKEEKHRREKDAMTHLTSLVDPEYGSQIYQLWEEYENQTTAEAKAVKDLDRFDMILQAQQYEQEEPERGQFLQEFFDSTQGTFKTLQVNEWTEELYRQRNETRVGENSNHGDGS